MATRTSIENELAPGFSILPGGNVMYQVATDYPKQIAEIMANYEARALNPRVNSLGPNPDSAARLQAELIDPFREAFTAAIPQPTTTRAQQPRVFEMGNRLIQLDSNGQPVEIYTAPTPPPKPLAPRKFTGPTTVDKIGSPTIPASLTLDEWTQIAPSLDPRIATNAPVSAYLEMARNQNQPTNDPIATTAAAPVVDIAPQPQAAPTAQTKRATYKIIRN